MELLQRAYPTVAAQVLLGFRKVAAAVRDAFVAGSGMDVTMSIRTLKRWIRDSERFAGMAQRGLNPVHFAMDLALGNGTSPAVQTTLHQLVTQIIGVAPDGTTGG
jgi:cobaltochelatase CobS